MVVNDYRHLSLEELKNLILSLEGQPIRSAIDLINQTTDFAHMIKDP